MFLHHLLFLIIVFVNVISASQGFFGPTIAAASDEAETVRNLVAEPDYRAVRLRWQYQQSHSPLSERLQKDRLVAFNIKYCELAQWQLKKRCKEQQLPVDQQKLRGDHRRSLASGESDDAVVSLEALPAGTSEDKKQANFEATLANLRMLTKYSITVRAVRSSSTSGIGPHTNDHNFEEEEKKNNRHHHHHQKGAEVFVQTKSFAAKTSRCLANTSIIEVHTGPYFGGKISVEGAANNEDGCASFGNRSSTQSTYTLAIDHQLCGSKIINKTRIETMVIVHENRDILTHNSRRYLVLCTFTPQLYSLTASASVPAHLLRKVIDRLREKRLPFQVELLTTGSDDDKTAKTKAEQRKQLKKRHSLTNSTTHRPPFLSANLRDSRMLAEEDGSKRVAKKWSKKGEKARRSYASSTIISVAAACLTALALVGLLVRRRGFKTSTIVSKSNKEEAFRQEANKRGEHEKKMTVEQESS